MDVPHIRIIMHSSLKYGQEPDMSLKSWINAYAAIHAFEKIVDAYNNTEYPEDFEIKVEDIIKEFERGTGLEEIET